MRAERAASEAAQRQVGATATAEGYALALGATVRAWPTPTPSRVVSRAAGRVAEIPAEKRDGRLTITIELIPEL